MAKLYLVYDDNSGHPFELCPTLTEARKVVKDMGEDGEGAGSISKLEIKMTKKGVCDFIQQHFGVWIFEN
jgi:hypothetical protein